MCDLGADELRRLVTIHADFDVTGYRIALAVAYSRQEPRTPACVPTVVHLPCPPDFEPEGGLGRWLTCVEK